MMEKRAYSYQRFSSGSQAEGTSIERQDEEFIKYYRDELEPKGWVFDGSFVFRDKGVSSLHGKHRTKGKLGAFLALCEAGKIPSGSQLVVENFDRLSRECYTDQQALLTDLVVTHELGLKFLNPPMRLITKEALNSDEGEGIIYQLVGEMRRAHRESKRKSELIHKANKLKRQAIFNGEQIKMSSFQAPWLKPIRKAIRANKTITTGFMIIRWKAAIVKKIFNLRKSGLGMIRIATKLNDEKVKFISERQKSWGKPFIQSILHDRSVLGEYQCKRSKVVDGKRTTKPVGEPVSDYFPRIISNELFYAVQSVMDKAWKSKGKSGGRLKDPSEFLFRGKIVCGYTGERMVIKSTGKQTLIDGTINHFKYWRAYKLISEGSIKYLNSWRDDQLEELIIGELGHKEMDWARIQGVTDETPRENLEVKLLAAKAEKDDLSKKIGNWVAAVGDKPDLADVFTSCISDAKDKCGELEKQIGELNAAIANEETISGGFNGAELFEFAKRLRGDIANKEKRMRLISDIDQKIDRIEIYGFGWNWTPRTFELALPWVNPEAISKFRDLNKGEFPKFKQSDYPKFRGGRGKNRNYYNPFAVIYFRNGTNHLCISGDTIQIWGDGGLPEPAIKYPYGGPDFNDPPNSFPFNPKHYGETIERAIGGGEADFLSAGSKLSQRHAKKNKTPYWDAWDKLAEPKRDENPMDFVNEYIRLKTNADGVFAKGEGENLAEESLLWIEKDNKKLYSKVMKIIKSMDKV